MKDSPFLDFPDFLAWMASLAIRAASTFRQQDMTRAVYRRHNKRALGPQGDFLDGFR
jgi:hypothetical protein